MYSNFLAATVRDDREEGGTWRDSQNEDKDLRQQC